jgi:nitric oxide reductase NorD protein
VLADLSLSTDTWVSDEQRVIDVIRDSLWLFSEALGPPATPSACTASRRASATTSAFTASRASTRSRRPHPRPHRRLKPGFYTRIGAAIRYATQILAKRPEALRLLMILSDGKPNDVDHYEGRYGIEDTRMSLNAARQEGCGPSA